jgi:hypothetical protein
MLLALLAGAISLLQGCSLITIGYGKGEMLAGWKANEYFDLGPEQRDLFARRFSRFYGWHRYQQLPDYAAFLTTFRDRMEDGLTRDDLEWLAAGIRTRYAALAERGASDAAPVLATLTPQQIAHVQEKWARDNRRFVREYRMEGSTEEQKKVRQKRIIGQIEDWVGPLTREQEDRLGPMIDQLPPTERVRMQDRLRRQREFATLMETRSDAGAFAGRVRRWMLEWETARPPEFQQALNVALDRRIDFYVEVARILSPQQRATGLKRLQGFIDDFHALSRNPGNQRAEGDCAAPQASC